MHHTRATAAHRGSVTNTFTKLCRLLLDGDTVWGTVEIRPQRWGATTYRIVVYPPGINSEQRRRVRVWRGFYAWGTGLWLASTAILSGFTEPWTAVALACAVSLILGAVAFARAGSLRSAVRTADVTVPVPNPDRALLLRARQVQTIGVTMVRADHRLRDGDISVADHELVWHRAYAQLEHNIVFPSVGRYGGVR